MTRTDVHRAAAAEFDPADYQLRGVFDLHPEEGDGRHRVQVVRALLDEGYSFRGAPHRSGQCSHCGTRIRYAALMLHVPTGTLLYIGETCLDSRFELTKAEFRSLREQARLNRERSTRRERIAALVDEHPALAWLTYADTLADSSFLLDLARKLDRDGRLSPRQIEAAESALVKDTERSMQREARHARAAAAIESGVRAPEGRVEVEGEIVSIKERDGYMGGVEWKMIVRADEGWSVWLTIPDSLYREAVMFETTPNAGWAYNLRGARVAFTATLTRSDRDPLFAFGKRPAKCRMLARSATRVA